MPLDALAATDWVEIARVICIPFRWVVQVVGAGKEGASPTYGLLALVPLGVFGFACLSWFEDGVMKALCLYLMLGSGLSAWLLATGQLF